MLQEIAESTTQKEYDAAVEQLYSSQDCQEIGTCVDGLQTIGWT